MKRLVRAIRRPLLLVTTGLCLLRPVPALAWDPSTTHQGLLEAAVARSAMHLHWMDGSEGMRGVFSPLRLDPARLTADERRLVLKVQKYAHADSGARALGGPGACPGGDAPPRTQKFCVQGDLWENSALDWMRFGIVAETVPTARHSHHFLSRENQRSLRWTDAELPAQVLRNRQRRSNGEPLAGAIAGTNFAARGDATALAWLLASDDLLAPTQFYRHLERSMMAGEAAERDHHLAMALICAGALMHVLQDLSVPAHARGDASAFFAALSPLVGDRGLPLQEFTRVEYGRRNLPLTPPEGLPDGTPVADSVEELILGGPDWEGLGTIAGQRFFSESSLPAAAMIPDQLSPVAAATRLLAPHEDTTTLAVIELKGAHLAPWPAPSGYLRSSTGRVLAAFDHDTEGKTRLYLDSGVFREQATTLLPLAVEASRSLLDILWPDIAIEWTGKKQIALSAPADVRDLTVTVFHEDPSGHRTNVLHRSSATSAVRIILPDLSEGVLAVLVLRGKYLDGTPFLVSQQIIASTEPASTEPASTEPAST